MTVSITENLQALQDKLGSKAASATEAKDLVYLAKSIEALLGTDLLIQSIRGDKNTKTINVKSSDTTATLTSADINNSILTLDNPDTSASKQTATFTIANVEENDVFAITIGDNTFSVTADATATVTTIRDALVIAINTTANWQEGHILMDATSVGTTKLKVTALPLG